MVSLENQDVVPKKRQKTSILDNFTKLKNDEVKVRVKNGALIVKHLKNEADEKAKDEFNHTLVRLIRGLGSPLVNARAGYFSTLVVLLKAHDVTFEEIYGVFTKHLSTGGNNSKSENADVYCGQILLWGAVIRAGLFSELSQENQVKILEVLMQAGKKRSYLSLMVTVFVLDLIKQTDEKCFTNSVWPILKGEIDKPWHNQNLEGAFLIVNIHRKFPKWFKKKSSAVCKVEDLRSHENLGALCTLLIDVSLMTVKHPIYKVIPEVLLELNLAENFVKIADEHLNKTNRNRLIAMGTLLKALVDNTNDGNTIVHLLGDNFIKQTLQLLLLNQQKHKDVEFEKHIQTLFVSVTDALKKPDVKWQTKIAVIEKLLFEPGVFTFEKITKTKVVQQIVHSLCNDGVKKMAEIYEAVVLKKTITDKNENFVNSDRIYAAQLSAKLLNHPAVQTDHEWKQQRLLFLLRTGLTKNDCVGSELASSIKKTFYSSALNIKFVKLHAVCTILSELASEIDSIIENTPTIMRDDVSDETVEIWRRTYKLIKKFEAKKTKLNKVKGVFHFLFLQMGLQLFNETKLAVDSLNELFSCYEKSKNTSKIEMSEGDPLWIEVVIELFLNLLSHNSHLLRSVVGYVFPHLCEYVDESAMNQILSVLDVKDNPLSDTDDSSDDGNDGGDESSGEDTNDDGGESDIETVNDKLRMAVRNALGGHQTDEESVDIDDMSETEANRLDTALAEAFKQYKPNRGKNKKQTKQQETLTHFRVRSLDLIDIYFDNNPKMSVCLQTIVPLLELLEFTIRNDHQKQLHDRISSCLKKMSNLKNIEADDTTADVLSDLLKSLLEKGTKTALVIQEIGDKIADCCIFILRCRHLLKTSQNTPKKVKKKLNLVDAVVSDEMEVHFKQKESLTVYILLKTILPLNWVENVSYVRRLYEYVFSDDVKQFRKNQALDLLRVFYKNQRVLGNDEIAPVLCECEEQFVDNTRAFFSGFDQTTMSVSDKFVCSLLDLLVLIKRSPNKKSGSIDWPGLIEGVKKYRSKVPFGTKATKQAYNCLCNLIGVTNKIEGETTKTTKPKSMNTNGHTIEVKTTKKKANKKLSKLKKESQELRLKNSSEGLEGVSFATANLKEVGDDEGEPVEGSAKRGVKRPKSSKERKQKKVKKSMDEPNEYD